MVRVLTSSDVRGPGEWASRDSGVLLLDRTIGIGGLEAKPEVRRSPRQKMR